MKQYERLDAKSMITKALASGAVAMLRPNPEDKHDSQKGIADAYQALKAMIEKQYEQVEVDLLEIGPGSAERQEAIAQQLDQAGAVEDENILRQAQLVLDIISEEDPTALWASEVIEPPPHLRQSPAELQEEIKNEAQEESET
jgi:hypothetical protein